MLDRHNIKAKYVLETMMQYCLSVYSDLFSISSFEKVLKAASLPGSKRTISNYLQHIEEAFFLIVHDKFSYSPRKRIMNPKKVYLLDVGFSLLSTDFSENKGKVLENVVAVELFRRKKEAFYHKGRAECDFVVKQGMKCASAIQVCWELTEKNKDRELNGVVEAMKASGAKHGLILTYDDEATLRHKGHTVAVMPVWRWLLREKAD
jgi:hypothetical protein